MLIWRETELTTSPFYLSARHKHQRSNAGLHNHWSLPEYISGVEVAEYQKNYIPFIHMPKRSSTDSLYSKLFIFIPQQTQ
jgi:hypothetical protein